MSGSAGNTSPHGISLPPALVGGLCFIIGGGTLISLPFANFLYNWLIPIVLLLIGAGFLLIALRSRPRSRPDLKPLGGVSEPPRPV